MRHLIAIVALTLAALPAVASTPDAWRQLEREAKRSCIESSAFAQPRASNMIVFDDATGLVAVLVSGRFPQPRMKGATGTNLCLYDRRTGRIASAEARGWQHGR